MKKCKYCSGNGYTYDGTECIGSGINFRLVNKKVPCKKCFGKGMK